MQLDLSAASWTLTGWIPYAWAWGSNLKRAVQGDDLRAHQCTPEIPAHVPGSVQDDLLRAGLLPDWNDGLNARLCEWVEHRHWEYRARVEVPAEWEGQRILLSAEGLDYAGHVFLDGELIGDFTGMLVSHEFELTSRARPGKAHTLSILFEEAPHEQGQLGYTSRSRYFKARFAYGWDWCPRLAPIGIWDRVFLRAEGAVRFRGCLPHARYDGESGMGSLSFRLDVEVPSTSALACRVLVSDRGRMLADQVLPCAFAPGRSETLVALPSSLSVEPWWPNGMGDRRLYDVQVTLETVSGQAMAAWDGRVGFKTVRWLPCQSAPANAEPWICEVNGKTVFLQGINWTPVRMTYGSVTRAMYESRLRQYVDLGINTLRVWGGAFLEKREFYDLCDELGMLVWQEFPLSSSGADNLPPHDAAALAELGRIATSYVWRRGGHVSHLLWCGGNELTAADGRSTPVNAADPAVNLLGAVCARLDPDKRFLATSPSGPSFAFDPEVYGLGFHHDTHGPWDMSQGWAHWKSLWDGHDALFVSEVGVPACSSVELLRRHAGDLQLWPPEMGNPAWGLRSPWWVQWSYLSGPNGFARERDELARFVELSQAEQARALEHMASACKRRFPHCGGVIVWMGHDCYPCPCNTSILDYDGNPKPAALALKRVFTEG